MTADIRWYSLLSKKHALDVGKAFSLFRDGGIEPVLIKGLAAAANYPDDKPRPVGDIDLAVSSKEFDAAKGLIGSGVAANLPIDLHCELRHLDTLAWDDLFANSVQIKIEDAFIRVLGAEDHLRVLATHWLNDGGAYKDRLWDIYFAVSNRPPDFDWEKCLGVVSAKRRRWVIAAIGLAHKYLGLAIDDLPFAEEARRLPHWLTASLEKEWGSEVRLISLDACLHDPKILIKQIRKRFPPNPIQATIETEGEFDEGSRVPYQIRDVFFRLVPFVRRVAARAVRWGIRA